MTSEQGDEAIVPDEVTRASSGLVPAPAVPLVVRRRGARRVTTDAAPGTDPAPAPESRGVDSRENDSRLRADVPPHWG